MSQMSTQIQVPQTPTVETVNEDDEKAQDDEDRPEDVIENNMIGLKYREEPILTDADIEELEEPIGDKSMCDLAMDHLRTDNPTESGLTPEQMIGRTFLMKPAEDSHASVPRLSNGSTPTKIA